MKHKTKRKNRPRTNTVSRSNLRRLANAVPDTPAPPLYSMSVDRMRGTFSDELKKCPHGVPATKICAICDPVGFRFEYGWD